MESSGCAVLADCMNSFSLLASLGSKRGGGEFETTRQGYLFVEVCDFVRFEG